MATDTGKVKQLPREQVRAAPLIINLGCGVKTSDLCINVDWSIYIILEQNKWLLPLVAPLIGHYRAERVKGMRGKTISHNLKKGIPFPTNSADAVYHSHLMEHIDRDAVIVFQKEICRVLKPGGVQRLCIPDLEQLVSDYSKSLAADDLTREASLHHDILVAEILEQSVRRTPAGAKGQSAFRIWLENLLLGDARKRGETHQWMWDRVNVRAVLADAGFTDISIRSYDVSDIEGWKQTGLERTSDGLEYRPKSLYVECRKPTNS
jgi:SAM-dependent methyltransferase